MSSLFSSAAWHALTAHQASLAKVHMKDLFAADPQRFQKMSLQMGDLLVDFSKNRIAEATLPLLAELAQAADLSSKIEAMFSGEKINTTENRAVLHTALRAPRDIPVYVDGQDVMPDVYAVLDKMAQFTDKVREGTWTGYTGQAITDIVNIGIGGSDLGPQMVCDALYQEGHPRLSMHFISNVDGAHITRTLSQLNAASTLFIIASKTFSTTETLTNALTARSWFLQQGALTQHISQHFVAVSTNTQAAVEFGIDPANIFKMWDWVGGRYSLWSAVGLPIMLYIGQANFRALLDGAHTMDTHFRSTPFLKNIPVVLALLSIWYINFWQCKTHLISPYIQRLSRFPAYLQQLEMESNGKQVHLNGEPVACQTAPVIWGEPGNNGQHAYYQFLHQGTQLTPVDFIGTLTDQTSPFNHQMINLANMLAQAEALMGGKTDEEIIRALAQQGNTTAEIAALLPHKRFEGNRPSNTLTVYQLNPTILGTLIALYEHKVFVQGAIWQINSFDQWGVELGKALAKTIETDLTGDTMSLHDGSTSALIQYIRKHLRGKAQ
jgi:glucose-6-phosphate isomerase